MSDLAQRPTTYEDLLALPDNVVGEILDGVLYTQPRPAPRHAVSASQFGAVLGGEFGSRFGGSGGWRILDEPELHLGADVVVPDIAGWRRERMPELPESAWFELTPDWVCEVLSPSTARKDRVVKQAIYAREAVPWLWLVDPGARTLEAFELVGGRWTVLCVVDDDAGELRIAPFETLAFPLARSGTDGASTCGGCLCSASTTRCRFRGALVDPALAPRSHPAHRGRASKAACRRRRESTR